MRVLWFVPTCLPAVRDKLGLSHNDGGWWIESLMNALLRNSDIKFGVVWSSREIHKKENFVKNGVHYYCLPEGEDFTGTIWKARQLLEFSGCSNRLTENIVKACCNVVYDFKPDIIHIHGSERPYGLIGERVSVPIVLSIQGILSEYIKFYFGQLSFSQRVAIPNLLLGFLHMRRRAILEKKIFHACKFFMGRTLWDKSHQAILNPDGHFFHCGELLRPEFYKFKWDISRAIKYTIYTTTSCLPYKGIDTLLDAVAILRCHFPNLCLRIGGNIPYQGFGKFLRRKAITLGLENIVKFLGWIPAENIAHELERANLFVIPSFIENSPNSLAEAQLVGMPVIGSSAGGIPSMVADNQSGLLFPPGDVAVLAMNIRRMFDDNNLALQCSAQARQVAISRHSEEKVVAAVLNAYEEICCSKF